MKIPLACIVLALPLALTWSCGASNTATGGGAGETGAGADGPGGPGGPGSGGDGVGGPNGAGGIGDLVGFGGDTGNPPGGGSGGATATGGTTNTTGGVAATGTTLCSNGIDDDGDGLIDGFDPECTGAADNDEATFATGIPGDNRDAKKQDCFFDGNSGAGDDGCVYPTGCLTGELDPEDPDCALTDACVEFCAPLVPNGCDCFGCCTVDIGGGDSIDIQTTASCSLDQVDNEEACPRCVKSDACGNTCGRCELCPGRTIADLPEDCTPPPSGTGGSNGTGGSSSTGGSNGSGGTTGGGPSYVCDGGETVCGPGLPICSPGRYCSLGCCIQSPPK